MALIYRNGRPYLYRSVRREGHVTSVYIGCGETALLIAAYEAIERESSDLETMIRQGVWRDLDEIDQALDQAVKRAIGLAHEALAAAGYHQHHRGDWRKRRVKGPNKRKNE
jgi:hypothetical protein